jgi:hypothetical protein
VHTTYEKEKNNYDWRMAMLMVNMAVMEDVDRERLIG